MLPLWLRTGDPKFFLICFSRPSHLSNFFTVFGFELLTSSRSAAEIPETLLSGTQDFLPYLPFVRADLCVRTELTVIPAKLVLAKAGSGNPVPAANDFHPNSSKTCRLSACRGRDTLLFWRSKPFYEVIYIAFHAVR